MGKSLDDGLANQEFPGIPRKVLLDIINLLMGFRNDTVDFRKAHLRPSVATIYPLFVFMYALLVSSGLVANFAMVVSIVKDKLYRDQTYCYLINLAIANVLVCLVVLPISLTILLIQNWIFGSFLCYFLPMLQVIFSLVFVLDYNLDYLMKAYYLVRQLKE
ncbi:hypothetical protein GE061_006924 [Apolygus lucorum]|uniref:G-protein coupled receptors family 1 profile domain-containing protein n=1 Tax=Apolygus lucorum TaxID=248454 RepID=A0A8S9WS18_APOLU|nr:hypothetical protein GE061_006924 [Apolygus lucorum]